MLTKISACQLSRCITHGTLNVCIFRCNIKRVTKTKFCENAKTETRNLLFIHIVVVGLEIVKLNCICADLIRGMETLESGRIVKEYVEEAK